MTIEEYKELEILLGGLQVVGLTKSTEKRLEKSLQVIQRDKQLLITDVVVPKGTLCSEMCCKKEAVKIVSSDNWYACEDH